MIFLCSKITSASLSAALVLRHAMVAASAQRLINASILLAAEEIRLGLKMRPKVLILAKMRPKVLILAKIRPKVLILAKMRPKRRVLKQPIQ